MNTKIIENCKMLACSVRRDILDMSYLAGEEGAHIGGSLSLVEILVVLYSLFVKYDAQNSSWEYRDRVILSKGHAAMTLYAVLAECGIIEKTLLSQFKKDGGLLCGHPTLNGISGIEFASGSLGMGLSQGVGVALALNQKRNSESRVYVILGDGECDEGSVWEAAMSAAQFSLNRLIAIVDCNGLQYDGTTSRVMGIDPISAKWKSFGWEVINTDGHCVESLFDAFMTLSNKPLAIIAKTVKGKGVSFMEGKSKYHNATITKEMYRRAIEELEKSDD